VQLRRILETTAAIVILNSAATAPSSVAMAQTPAAPSFPRPIYFLSSGETPQSFFATHYAKMTRARFWSLFSLLNRHFVRNTLTEAVGMEAQSPTDKVVILPDPQAPDTPFGWFWCDDAERVVRLANLSEDSRIDLRESLRHAIHRVLFVPYETTRRGIWPARNTAYPAGSAPLMKVAALDEIQNRAVLDVLVRTDQQGMSTQEVSGLSP
jgi:hypothetical protein